MDLDDYRFSINIFCLIGLYLQEPKLFKKFIDDIFQNNSLKYKFLISKAIPLDYEQNLINYIKANDLNDDYYLVLRRVYLNEEKDINLLKFLENGQLDIIDLILLEDFQKIKNSQYSKEQEQLTEDIFKIAHNIQSKHKILNNTEDQYNSMFQSLLEIKGYVALDQTMRGSSDKPNSKRAGELDILISKNGYTLSIFEAFIIDSISSEYIKKHLLKLSNNYDPNGLRLNYAVIYAKSTNFVDLWQRYRDFVKTINFDFPLFTYELKDISNRFPEFTELKVGFTEHLRSETRIKVYHIFMNMNF